MSKEDIENGPKVMAWISIERPGYLGKRKDEKIAEWNQKHGEHDWRLIWETKTGEKMTYEDVFWKVFVAGYVNYFVRHQEEADFLTQNFSYGYDKDLVTKEQAFNPRALYEKPGRPNQFHNVALNIALEWFLGKKFVGREPIQIRGGKPRTDESTWPMGWKWHPGRIPAVRADLIPNVEIKGRWPWQPGSIEDFYQKTKMLQIRNL